MITPTCYINRQSCWDKVEISAQLENTCYINRQGETQGFSDASHWQCLPSILINKVAGIGWNYPHSVSAPVMLIEKANSRFISHQPMIGLVCVNSWAYYISMLWLRTRQFQSLSRRKKWSLCRQDDIQRAAVGLSTIDLTFLPDNLKYSGLPVLNHSPNQGIRTLHLCNHFCA